MKKCLVQYLGIHASFKSDLCSATFRTVLKLSRNLSEKYNFVNIHLGDIISFVVTFAYYINIGIKHCFSCINVCQVPREVLKTEAKVSFLRQDGHRQV